MFAHDRSTLVSVRFPRLASFIFVCMSLVFLICTVLPAHSATRGSADWLTGPNDYQSVGGGVPTVAIRGTQAFIGEGASLVALDISNTAAPRRIGSLLTRAQVSSVIVDGNRAYMAAKREGLLVVDITDPTRMRLLGQFTKNDGNTFNRLFWDVKVVGTTAYVVGERGLVIVDVRDPTAMRQISAFGLSEMYEVAISGTRAYLVQGNQGLLVVDISNPVAPQQQDAFFNDPVLGVQIVGGTIFYTTNQRLVARSGSTAVESDDLGKIKAVFVADGRAYVTHYGGKISIFDVSVPGALTLLGQYTTPGSSWDVRTVGTTAYIADGANGLLIVNAANPQSVQQLGLYATWAPQDVRIRGRYAYVAAGRAGIRVVDMLDSSGAAVIGMAATTLPATKIEVVGQRAYVLGRFVSPTFVVSSELVIFNIADPRNPTLLSRLTLEYANSMAVSGTTVYVNHSSAQNPGPTLTAIDTSNPSAPRFATLSTNLQYKYVNGLFVDGTRLYVQYNPAAAGNRFAILDVSGITPQPLGEITQGVTQLSFTANAGYIYQDNGLGRIRVFDARNPAQPVTIPGDTITLAGKLSMVVRNNIGYILEDGLNEGSLQVIDYTNPETPIATIQRIVTDPGLSIAADENHLLLALGEGGMEIYQPLSARTASQVFVPLTVK